MAKGNLAGNLRPSDLVKRFVDGRPCLGWRANPSEITTATLVSGPLWPPLLSRKFRHGVRPEGPVRRRCGRRRGRAIRSIGEETELCNG